MAASAVCYERLPSDKDGYRRLAEVFSPRFASWAFLFGGTIVLPATMVFAARNWAAHDTHPDWATAWRWAVASLLFGFFIFEFGIL